MPDEDTNVAVLDKEDQDVDDEDQDSDDNVDADNEDKDEDADADADGDDSATDGADSGSDGDGGSGDAEPDESDQGVASVVPPTGKALLELLAADTEAQQLLSQTLQQMQAEAAANAAAQAEALEFRELVEKGDYQEIGRRVTERAAQSQFREQITIEALKAEFQPVYAELFAEPELQNLTAEEKEALNPQKYRSDAHYVRALEGFIREKRFNKAVEAEVEKRIKARDEAASNRSAAAKAKGRSVSASPGGIEGAGVARSSRELIAEGLKAIVNGGVDDDGDDE